MRILAISNFPPFVLGGAENQVARLIETWMDLGHHVEVAGHRIPNGVIQLGRAEIRTHHLAVVDRAGRLGRATSYFSSLAFLLHRIKKTFDVIYCRGLGDGAISLSLLKAIGSVSLPLVACPINAKGAGDSNFVRTIPAWRLIRRLINTHCDAINIISPAILSDLIELGIAGPRITHIPNGIKICDPVRKSRAVSIRYLIWVGRITVQKGIDILLKSLANVMAAGREFKVEIIGDGPDRTVVLEQCQKLGLEEKVHFTGAVPREAIRDKLVQADAFILPSRYEGMSNAALEAMEAGLPVLLTRCGGIDSYITEKCGWICEPGDVDGLAAGLIKVLDTTGDKLLEMGHQARLLVERNFRIEKIGRQNIELFKQLVNSPPS
ncbi:MAG: glycosyltransferase family 4 protein [Pontiellaceae bacterium]|jgi:glycosyltransferase involved in cell wall biosynthesis|nr:glycosyltransferase family 4 protein [Pontiellaceae bacterium]